MASCILVQLLECVEQGSAGAFKNPNLTGADDSLLLALARVSLRMTAVRAADRPSITSVLKELMLAGSVCDATMDNVGLPDMSSLQSKEAS